MGNPYILDKTCNLKPKSWFAIAYLQDRFSDQILIHEGKYILKTEYSKKHSLKTKKGKSRENIYFAKNKNGKRLFAIRL